MNIEHEKPIKNFSADTQEEWILPLVRVLGSYSEYVEHTPGSATPDEAVFFEPNPSVSSLDIGVTRTWKDGQPQGYNLLFGFDGDTSEVFAHSLAAINVYRDAVVFLTVPNDVGKQIAFSVLRDGNMNVRYLLSPVASASPTPDPQGI